MTSTSKRATFIGMGLPLLGAILMSITLTPCIAMGSPQPSGPRDVLILTGTVTNAQGKGVKEAAVMLFVDGKKLEFEDEPVTENLGTYKAEIVLPPGTLPTAKVALAVQKPCYEDTDPLSVDTIVPARSDGKGSTTYLALLMPEVFASNVGGTATLIGDPPNIMIGSYAQLSFLDFVQNLGIVCIISLAATVVYFIYWYKKDYLKAQVVDVKSMIGELKKTYRITDRKLLFQSLLMLGITIFLFIIHGALHMEPSIAAMAGAGILVMISRVNIVELLEHEIEWPTLIFFMMLFVIVAGAEETGLIQIIADWVNHMSRGSLVAAIVMILWVSALASAIIDNIPFTATMLPIVAYLNEVVPGAQGGILWWALALGACLGGNGTMIGASANVVTVGIAETQGYRITFMQYVKAAFVPMIITIVLSTIWLLVVR